VRAGAAQLWGEAPLLDRLSLGGDESLRGFARQRFTGDALVYGSLELRSALTRSTLLVRGDLGVLAFVDAGRVYEDGVSEGGWHRGYGAGVWFESLGYAVSASYAHGEDDRLYLRLGMPF
jgi:outer membrane translocation and assembly module TamA